MVDKADNGLPSPLHVKGGFWNTAITSHVSCCGTRINLDINRLDFDLIVVDVIEFAIDDQTQNSTSQVCFTNR
jgi:hypothetical protein